MAVMTPAAMYRLARRVKRRTAQTPMALTIPSAGLMHSAAASGNAATIPLGMGRVGASTPRRRHANHSNTSALTRLSVAPPNRLRR